MNTYEELARAVFNAVDEQNVPEYLTYFTPDAQFTFGNNPTVKGASAIGEYCRQFYTAISGLSHELLNVWHDGDAIIVPATVTYTRKNQTTVQLPCVSVLRLSDGKIWDYRVYMDANPIFA